MVRQNRKYVQGIFIWRTLFYPEEVVLRTKKKHRRKNRNCQKKKMLATSQPVHSRGNIQQPTRYTLGGFATSQRPSDCHTRLHTADQRQWLGALELICNRWKMDFSVSSRQLFWLWSHYVSQRVDNQVRNLAGFLFTFFSCGASISQQFRLVFLRVFKFHRLQISSISIKKGEKWEHIR
jgi:hypothetical protein